MDPRSACCEVGGLDGSCTHLRLAASESRRSRNMPAREIMVETTGLAPAQRHCECHSPLWNMRSHENGGGPRSCTGFSRSSGARHHWIGLTSIKKLVLEDGIAPSSAGYQPAALLLSYSRDEVAGAPGIAPSRGVLETLQVTGPSAPMGAGPGFEPGISWL